MQLTALDKVLWACAFLSSVAVLVILLWRGQRRRFPVFTSWIAFSAGNSILAYAVYRLYGLGSHLYAQLYWHSLWPIFVLQVGTIAELARAVLRRNGKWVGDARRLLLFAAFGGVLVSALLSVWIVPPRGVYAAWELRGDLFTSLVLCELLVSVSLIANRLSLAWEGNTLAIAEALTGWNVVSLVVNGVESYLGSRFFKEIDHFQTYAWIGAMIWIAMEFGLPNANVESTAGQAPAEVVRNTKQFAPGTRRHFPGSLARLRATYPQPVEPVNSSSSPPAVRCLDGAQS